MPARTGNTVSKRTTKSPRWRTRSRMTGTPKATSRATAATQNASPPLAGAPGKCSRDGAQIDAARSPLHQRDVPVVPVHEGGEEQVDGEEDRHDDDDCLDLLAGLVHHRAGENLEDLR